MNTRLTDEEICKLWTQCYNCQENLPTKELEKNLQVCPKCGYHIRISARKRLEYILDSGSHIEIGADISAVDRLKFKDLKKYKDRLVAAQKDTGEASDQVAPTGVWLLRLPSRLICSIA